MRWRALAAIAALTAIMLLLTAGPHNEVVSAVTVTPSATRTPTPTRTSTARPTTSKTPTATKTATSKTPTPVPALPPRSLPARFFATVTWFGESLSETTALEALIWGTVCGSGSFKDGGFIIDVKADADHPGCGVTGAPVIFRIGGMLANETAVFVPGMVASISLTGPRMTSVPLLPGFGCNNLASTYPDRTPVMTLRAAVHPAGALIAIWRWNGQTAQWEADVPGVAAASTLTAVNFADPLWVCVGTNAIFRQPETS